jgi:hypothetical protein
MYLRANCPRFIIPLCSFSADLSHLHLHSQVPLDKYFTDYTAELDIDKAAKYILWRFMQANRA